MRIFCKQCGNEVLDNAAVCVKCGVATSVAPVNSGAEKTRVIYVVLGLFLGCLGIHNFYAGYTGKAIIQLLITVFTGWLIVPWIAVGIWAIIDIVITTKDSKGVPFV